MTRDGETRATLVAMAVAAVTLGVAALVLYFAPRVESVVLARGAANVAALLSGSPVVRAEEGYAVPGTAVPVLVTKACSAGDFACMVAALIGWNVARRRRPGWVGALAGLVAAGPLTIGINALRILAVAQAHRWVIPHFAPSYASFLHLATGVAVFLPALIALNLLFVLHERRQPAVSS